ncbi:MAG: electron transfer flavoprotein subunit alpha/FixB family protein [Nitrososphaerota archaeon]|nr:electron transfer flavoprotein subunit alpha/FixB family protein [Aigarchaeota archaeon]MDW8076624.1 electron transfer flavoprotein subunit alpha/FixB family protein [Nitrososphaerota archaeon]
MTEGAVLVFSEEDNFAFELLALAKKLSDQLGSWTGAIILGDGSDRVAKFTEHGADKIFVVPDIDSIKDGTDVIAEGVSQVVLNVSPRLILIAATKIGKEVAAYVAQSLHTGCASECLDVLVEGPWVEVTRLVMGGGFLARQIFESYPAVVTIPPRRFQAVRSKGEGKVENVKVVVQRRMSKLESRAVEKSGVKLEDAEVVVAVGRGLKRKDDLKLAEELAKVLGAELGCTRPISGDLKWLPDDRHIGLSGKRVKPKLYIAVGISGQIQHVVGMRESKTVVCINTDPNAPMHKEADYSIVGDLYKVLPALINAVKRIKGQV